MFTVLLKWKLQKDWKKPIESFGMKSPLKCAMTNLLEQNYPMTLLYTVQLTHLGPHTSGIITIKMKHRVFEVNDIATAECKISRFEKMFCRMKASATALNTLYVEAEVCPEGGELRKIDETTAKELTELRSKALNGRRVS